ncbi:hypothetical protein [Streptomyces eurocidicus]|uniref:Uncharacterized protein n=1 Tax=Streptomyces eurocidicus TaxID=66423 RepID=A0A7W8BGM3_STREU|nr:hypothetical protein [Streptomyces eurocidicus]MBB5123081.1 hypothetical protein [Streptomyces eurocidicus]
MKCTRCGAELERYVERPSGPGIFAKVRHHCPEPPSKTSAY